MATLKELQEQLRREKNKLKAKEEIEEIGRKRAETEREIRRTRFKRKYGGLVKFGKAAGSAAVGVGKAVYKGAGDVQRYASRPKPTIKKPKVKRIKRRKVTSPRVVYVMQKPTKPTIKKRKRRVVSKKPKDMMSFLDNW